MAEAAIGSTVARADRADEWLTMRLGIPADEAGWLRYAGIDAEFIVAWERSVAARQRHELGRSHPMTSASYVLGWYAGLPGQVGGACFRLDRRVPRLQPEDLALHRHPTEHYPDGVALLDERFWCLPDDPAADDPAATVVADDAALAAVLRGQVREHADRFLSWYTPGARLAQRNLLGAFFDGLDCGIWTGGEHGVDARELVLADAALVLPGHTPEFWDASTLYLLTDDRGRTHLTRERVSCCHSYKINDAGVPCFTCPRTDTAERPVQAGTWDEEH